MKRKYSFILSTFTILIATWSISPAQDLPTSDNRFVSYIADPKKQDVKLYWKNDKQEIFGNIQTLKSWLDSKHITLVFAMNAGMYKKDFSPQGLFIEDQKTITLLDSSQGNGNFYLKPNGIFYIRKDQLPVIVPTTNFRDDGEIAYATQSGPMLVIDGEIHPAFKKNSANLNIRNGVGILPDNRIIFAMSKKEINFYEFAKYFKKLGCNNALYLDGLISRTYLPEQGWIQTDGNLGVLIGVTKN
jgi:uncharacterized protein YigE (DUF2233 family)